MEPGADSQQYTVYPPVYATSVQIGTDIGMTENIKDRCGCRLGIFLM